MFQFMDIFDLLQVFLPLIIVIGLTVGIWVIGGRINKRMLKNIEAEITRVTKGSIVSDLDLEGTTAASKVLTGSPIIKYLRSFKALIQLEERHLLITFVFSLFSASQDYILFEAEFPDRPPASVEIIPWKEKRLIEKNSKFLTKLDLIHFKNERFDSTFMVRSNRRGIALEILGDKELFKTLYQARDYLYWISVDPKEKPHLKVMIHWKKGMNLEKMVYIFQMLTARTNESEYEKKLKSYGGKQKKEKTP